MVKKVQSLSVKYTFRWKGEVKEQTPKAASGCSRGIGGQLTLYIAQVTWREIAKSLCLGILKKVENNDIFLLQSLLSATLDSLNLSYDADRIQNRRADYRQSKQGGTTNRSSPSKEKGRSNTHGLHLKTEENCTRDDLSPDHVETMEEPHTIKNPVYLGRVGGAELYAEMGVPCGDDPGPAPEDVDFSSENELEDVRRAIGRYKPHLGEKARGPNEGEDIRRLKRLIQQWTSTRRNTKDIIFIGDVDGVRVYTEEGIPTARESLLEAKLDCIKCLISIIRPLEQIYELPPSSLHIYYSSSRPDYALWREGAIFLNLRYFEHKHMWKNDQQRDNMFEKGLVSWYYTVACLLANNLAGPNWDGNSQVVGNIVEAHLTPLIDNLHDPDRWIEDV